MTGLHTRRGKRMKLKKQELEARNKMQEPVTVPVMTLSTVTKNTGS